VLGGSSAERST